MENSYPSLSVAIEALKKEGFTHDFNLHEEGVQNRKEGTLHGGGDLNVVKFFRFEGYTNPDDSSVLYAIEMANGEKGLLVDAYGAYSGQMPDDVLEKLKMR